MDTIEAVVPSVITEPFAGGFYAGRIRVGTEIFALVVAPKAQGDHADIVWNESVQRVEAAASFNDGLANTQAMAAAGSELGKWALGLTIGGFADWYLPSRDELELMYRAFKPTTEENEVWRHGDNPSSLPPGYPYMATSPAQCALPEFQGKGSEAFDDTWYWSSTQSAGYDGYAWSQTFDYGTQYGCPKDDDLRARAVRRLKI